MTTASTLDPTDPEEAATAAGLRPESPKWLRDVKRRRHQEECRRMTEMSPVPPDIDAALDALVQNLEFVPDEWKGPREWGGKCPNCGNPTGHLSLRGLVCERLLCLSLDLEEACERFGLNAADAGPQPTPKDDPNTQARKLPPPLGIPELMLVEEPEEEWLVEELILVASNAMLAAYPKTYKTMLLLELAVALATGTPFLGRFRVPLRRRVGIVLMEDQAYRVRRRLARILAGRGLTLDDVDGWLYLWFRPPLRFDDETVVELGDYAAELDLDFLGVDSWAYVAGGDSNSSDDVTPQLQALSAARVKRPGLTLALVHHARKESGDRGGKRLTDIIRNSSAFGAWYDVGIVLSREDELSPVTVRAELRDHPAPEPFAFTVEDEDPAGPHNEFKSSGWLRILASDQRPETLERERAVKKLVPKVKDFLAKHFAEGVSLSKLRRGVTGANADVEAAAELLVASGEAEYTPSPGPGRPANYRLRADPAEPCLDPAAARSGEDPADPAAPPVGGGQGQGPRATGQAEAAGQGSLPLGPDPWVDLPTEPDDDQSEGLVI